MPFISRGEIISPVFYPRLRGEGMVRVLIIIVFVAMMLGKPTFAADKIRIGYSGMTISNAILWVTEEGKLFVVYQVANQRVLGAWLAFALALFLYDLHLRKLTTQWQPSPN